MNGHQASAPTHAGLKADVGQHVVPRHNNDQVPGLEPGICSNTSDTNQTPTVFWYS